MPRNMSFAKTTQQVMDETKDVTRRDGWENLLPGEYFYAVEKCMGLKKGEKMRRLKFCQCVSNRREPLNTITQDDVRREGFPDWTPQQFIEFYCSFNKKSPDCTVSRIEFRYVPPSEAYSNKLLY